MIRNMGTLDRSLRVFLVAPALIVAALTGLATPPVLYGVLLVGTIGLVTGITGFCPTYVLLGISTYDGLHRVDHDIRAGHA